MRELIHTKSGTIFIYDFELIDSRMYMLRENDKILVIDPCINEEILPDINGVSEAMVFLTHEHYDHISGVDWLREKLPCTVYAGEVCASYICNEKKNATRRFPLLFILDKEKFQYAKENLPLPYTCTADASFKEKKEYIFEGHRITAMETPGHSPGSSLILLDDQVLFSGDSLLGNGMELKSYGASKESYEEKVLGFAERMPQDLFVCPGHGEPKELSWFLAHAPKREDAEGQIK